MILQRLNSELLGVEISRNMEINALVSALNTGLADKPELSDLLNPVTIPFSALQITSNIIQMQLENIISLKTNLKGAKRTLELAVKAYNIGSTLSMTLLDLKPAVSGSPPATGTQIALTPLKVAVENGTTNLQKLEDQLDTQTMALSDLTSQYKENYDLAVNSLFEKLAELGNKNINV